MSFVGIKGMPVSSVRVEGLMADFSGLNKLDEIVEETLRRLAARPDAKYRADLVSRKVWSLQDFDGWFSDLIKAELGKTLGIVRNNAVKKAREAGAGSASSGVLQRMYRSGKEGNINIASHRGRISSRERVVDPPTGGKSGIRRPRTVKKRTETIRKYYGPDRDFILRILDSGRDVFYATPEGPTGRHSMATYGRRGAITARNWFFHSMKSDMEEAARRLGITLVNNVEKWVEQQFTE